MSFTSPFYSLLILIPIFLIGFYLWAKARANRDLEAFVSPSLFAKIVDLPARKLWNQKWILRVAGLILLIFALCGPQWGYQWQEVRSQGLEIIFALDTSKSMLATDIKPSRLERAKLAVIDFLNKKIPGNKAGLIAFAGASFLQCPLTLDYNAFGIALDSLTVNSIPRGGTAIGDAIATAREAFKSAASGSKILILISDGENHEGDPVGEAKQAAEAGITIYTIGIGSPEGELIVTQDENGNSTYLKDENGNVIKSTLNEAILREIAQAAKGAYLRGTGLSLGLEELYQTRLSKLNKTEVSSKWQKRYIDRYQIPLFVALLILLAELGLGLKFKSLRLMKSER
jgi:Ca-activated chloride channel family protein